MRWSAFYFRNLPVGITEEELRMALIESFRGFFEDAIQAGMAEYRIFNPGLHPRGGRYQVATVWLRGGFEVEFEELQAAADGQNVGGRNWRILEDFYEDRNETGELIEPMSAEEKKDRLGLRGEVHYKPKESLNPVFLAALGIRGYKPEKIVYFTGEPLDEAMLREAGRVRNIENQGAVTKITYATILEALQAIMFFTNNGLEVCDATGQFHSSLDYREGIASNGDLLDVRGITMEHGYLPFTVLREDLLNIPWLQAVPSRCWRCKNPWTIVGVQASLGYFVGNCECLYDT